MSSLNYYTHSPTYSTLMLIRNISPEQSVYEQQYITAKNNLKSAELKTKLSAARLQLIQVKIGLGAYPTNPQAIGMRLRELEIYAPMSVKKFLEAVDALEIAKKEHREAIIQLETLRNM